MISLNSARHPRMKILNYFAILSDQAGAQILESKISAVLLKNTRVK